MKNKKCPYCGRRINYSAVFGTKNKGSFICTRCKKESKVKVDNKLIILFIALVLIMILFMIVWCGSGNSNNIFGFILVAICMFGFYLCTPLFVNFVPLKKYVNEQISKETTTEIDTNNLEIDSTFVFNKEVFDRIKKQKIAGALNNINNEISSNIEKETPMVPVIEDVREAHISSSDAPLQKKVKPQRTYISQENMYEEKVEEVKEYTPRKKRPDGSKYTANRKF